MDIYIFFFLNFQIMVHIFFFLVIFFNSKYLSFEWAWSFNFWRFFHYCLPVYFLENLLLAAQEIISFNCNNCHRRALVDSTIIKEGLCVSKKNFFFELIPKSCEEIEWRKNELYLHLCIVVYTRHIACGRSIIISILGWLLLHTVCGCFCPFINDCVVIFLCNLCWTGTNFFIIWWLEPFFCLYFNLGLHLSA